MRVKISYGSKNILKINLKIAVAQNDAYLTGFIRTCEDTCNLNN